MVTPIGGFFDYEITDEGNPNNDWNPIWNSSTGRFDGGWTVEMEIPFKSLRFRPGVGQVWGLQLGRRIRYKNETTYLTTVPISAGPGMFRLSGGRDADWGRGAERQPQVRDQALRHRFGQQQP